MLSVSLGLALLYRYYPLTLENTLTQISLLFFIFIFILLLKNVIFIYCKFFFSIANFFLTDWLTDRRTDGRTDWLTDKLADCLAAASYIKHDICFITKNKKIEVNFVDFLLLENKPISVGIVYRPPTDTIFLHYLLKF